jgi:filamentous hemagglutinin
VCGSVSPGQPKRFTGKERDPETGLDYFGARYYGARIGRLTAVDPVYTWRENLEDPQRWNRYAYARDNPLRYTDPDGEFVVPFLVVVGAAAAYAILASPDIANAPGPNDPLYKSDQSGKLIANTALAVTSLKAIFPTEGLSPPDQRDATPSLTGTNERGQVTSRADFRKRTVQDAWDNAEPSQSGGRVCPTCRTDVEVEPFSGRPRDWDVSHDPSWTRREFPADVTRKNVRDNYQQGTGLECPSCNRGRGNRDEIRPK